MFFKKGTSFFLTSRTPFEKSSPMKMVLPSAVSLSFLFCFRTRCLSLKFVKRAMIGDFGSFRILCTLSNWISSGIFSNIHKHLTNFLETHQLFHSFQSGFRCGHSCQTAVTRLTDIWLSAFNNRQMSGAVFLDFRKAFDLVHHDILLKKLSTYKHCKYSFLKILFTGSYTIRACKWHILPRNVYNKCLKGRS